MELTVYSIKGEDTGRKVTLSDAGTLIWLENAGGKMVRHDSEPGTSWRQRAAVSVLSMLPIEWLL